MQALSCGSPSAMAASGGSVAVPETVEKPEVSKPAGTDRLINMIRLSATKPDLGTPSRVPVDSNGQRLCSTPKIARAAVGVRNHASQTPKSTFRASSGMRTLASPTPKKLVQAVENHIHTPLESSQKDSGVASHDLPLDSFTIYSNPSFEPLETIESPSKEPKQHSSCIPVDTNGQKQTLESPSKEPKQPSSCIPVDTHGQKLCPTPKRGTSPGVSKLRFPKATAFQPLETIQSPSVRKDQAKGVLVDSNGQWTQGTPKMSKQFTTPRERSAAFGTKCTEKLTPRALFDDSHGVASPRVSTKGVSSSVAKKPVVKKRGRGEDDALVEDENARVTRSKTEAERIALFLRSPAARVRPDGRREEYWHGISDVLVEKYTETKITSASETKLIQSAPKTKCPCED